MGRWAVWRGGIYPRRSASGWTLSWEDAQEEAGRWIGEQHLGRDLTGQVIDLSAVDLPHTGLFRKMVLEAVRRKLLKRGAWKIMLPPED
jgi:hypothetical protein